MQYSREEQAARREYLRYIRESYRDFVERSEHFIHDLIEVLVGTDDDLEIGLHQVGFDYEDEDLPLTVRRLRDLGVYQDPDDGFWYSNEAA